MDWFEVMDFTRGKPTTKSKMHGNASPATITQCRWSPLQHWIAVFICMKLEPLAWMQRKGSSIKRDTSGWMKAITTITAETA